MARLAVRFQLKDMFLLQGHVQILFLGNKSILTTQMPRIRTENSLLWRSKSETVIQIDSETPKLSFLVKYKIHHHRTTWAPRDGLELKVRCQRR